MKRTVQITADGSKTIAVEEMNVTYHSRHGAIQESRHVFIDAGLKYIMQQKELVHVSIFEMGFGTGLNALLSLKELVTRDVSLYYHTVEEFPLNEDEWKQLSHGKQLELEEAFEKIHTAEWNQDVVITEAFTLHKAHQSLLEIELPEQFDLIYYDAFAPTVQPELWTEEVFRKMVAILKPGGILVTYCSKADVRRTMIAAGFTVTKIPGPHGKRDMVRAIKS